MVSFLLGNILTISLPLKSMRILVPIPSERSIDSAIFNSQGLYLKA